MTKIVRTFPVGDDEHRYVVYEIDRIDGSKLYTIVKQRIDWVTDPNWTALRPFENINDAADVASMHVMRERHDFLKSGGVI